MEWRFDGRPFSDTAILAADTKVQMNFFSKFWDRTKRITVPPGHKVNVVHPVATAYLGRCESGVWIADLGRNGEFQHVVSQVEQLAFPDKALVVWIVQIPIMESPPAFERLLARLGSIIQQSRGFADHCAVVPHATHRHTIQMRRLMETGAGVHYSADDGACFTEVHRPDGIVIGVPGKPFAPDAGPADQTEQRTISDVFADTGPGEALGLEQAILNVAEHKRDEDFRALYALLRGRELYVPVQTRTMPAETKWGPRYMEQVTVQTTIPLIRGPDGGSYVPVMTPVERAKYADEFQSIKWTDFLKLVSSSEGAPGALLQSATSYVTFDQERIRYLLKLSEERTSSAGGSGGREQGE